MSTPMTYLSFDQNDTNAAPIAISSLEACISEIHHWMKHNKLKLNDDKADILLFSSNPFCSTTITIGTDQIHHSDAAKNLGVTLDSSMSIWPSQISAQLIENESEQSCLINLQI